MLAETLWDQAVVSLLLVLCCGAAVGIVIKYTRVQTRSASQLLGYAGLVIIGFLVVYLVKTFVPPLGPYLDGMYCLGLAIGFFYSGFSPKTEPGG